MRAGFFDAATGVGQEEGDEVAAASVGTSWSGCESEPMIELQGRGNGMEGMEGSTANPSVYDDLKQVKRTTTEEEADANRVGA